MKLRPEAFSAAARADRKRAKLAHKVPPGPLKDFFDTPPDPQKTPLYEAKLLAVDIETTGLDPRRDIVVAVGYVPLDGLSITLGGAGRHVVRPPAPGAMSAHRSSVVGGARIRGEVGQSATVHGLTDDVVAEGVPLEQALDALLVALRGRVLLAHFVSIERDFLSAACHAIHGVDLPLTMVDTLEMQRLIVGGPDGHVRSGKLRLATAREHFGLPRYRAHDALTDALACAELYLAQVTRLGQRGATSLGQVLE